MQIVSKRLGAIVLGACLLVAIAFGGFTAFAAVTWQGSGFSNSLTVEATNNDTMKSDIEKANVVVDVYRVATGANYDYTWVEPFGSGKIDISKLDNDGWQALANDAAIVIANDVAKEDDKTSSDSDPAIDYETIDAGAKLDKIDDGLYLLIAHGKDAPVKLSEDGAPELHAYSEDYDYKFEPALVAVPNRVADSQGKIDWDQNVSVSLKPERNPLYGSIKIIKELTNGTTEPRSFVFHLVGKTPNGIEYDNYAMVHFESGSQSETVVKHIPAGTELTITEEPTSGTGYRATPESVTRVVKADREVDSENSTEEMVFYSFENTPDGRTQEGYGIENNFELAKPESGHGESAWEWKWVTLQDQYATEG